MHTAYGFDDLSLHARTGAGASDRTAGVTGNTVGFASLTLALLYDTWNVPFVSLLFCLFLPRSWNPLQGLGSRHMMIWRGCVNVRIP